MADILLQKPIAGQSIALTLEPDNRLVFAFDSVDATLSRDGDNLVMSFDDGAHLTLTDFYVAYTAENMPTFLIEDTEIDGESFFAALGVDLMPAAGTSAPQGSGTGQGFTEGHLFSGIDRTDGLDQQRNTDSSLRQQRTAGGDTTGGTSDGSSGDGSGGTTGDTGGDNSGDGSGGNSGDTGGGDTGGENDIPHALVDEVAIIAKAEYKGNDFDHYFDKGNDSDGGQFIIVDAEGNELTTKTVNEDGTVTYELWGTNNGKDVNWGSVTFNPSTGSYYVEADGGWVSKSQMEFDVAFVDGNGDQSESVTFDVSEFTNTSVYESALPDGSSPNADGLSSIWKAPAGYTIDEANFVGGEFTGPHGEKYTVELNEKGELVFTLLSRADNPDSGEANGTSNHWVSISSVDVPLLDAKNEAHDITVSFSVVDDGVKVTDAVDAIENPLDRVKYEAEIGASNGGVVDLSTLYNFGADGSGSYSFMNAYTTFEVDANGYTQYDFDWGSIWLNRTTGEMTFEITDEDVKAPVVELYASDSEGDVAPHIYVTLNSFESTFAEETALVHAATDDAALESSVVALSQQVDILEKDASNDKSGIQDILHGDEQDDLLAGLDGDDILLGGYGDDILLGGSGSDILYGDEGADVLVGGSGDDLVVIDIHDIFVDAGFDADDKDIDILLGEGNFSNADIVDVMAKGDVELAIFGKNIEYEGQDYQGLLDQLGVSKADGQISLGEEWGTGQVQGNFTSFTQNQGTDEQIVILVENARLDVN